MFRLLPTIAFCCAAGMSAFACAQERRPNVLLIMADDFGYECVTANGGESYQTPHLDRLAATGMRFDSCHVQPLCTPTRVQLMTGLYNVRNYARFGHIDPQAKTIGHAFRNAGYATGIAGKWQLGKGKQLPQRLGFDEAFLWQHTRRPPRYANPGLELNGVALDYEKGEYGPKLINDFALDFIERHQDGPFFLYYPMILTHDPFQPPPTSPDWDPKAQGEQVGRDTKHFAEMTAYMDSLIGRLVDKLEALQLREETLIVFLGDNGTGASITSRFQGKPYQGGKGTSTMRGTHVPLIVNWPKQTPAGRVNSDLVASVDLLPTLCEACGVKIAEPIDGRSFLPQILGKPGTPRESLYCWYARNGGARAKFEFVMTKQHKLYRDGRFIELATDPLETRPLNVDALSGENAEIAQRLGAVLEQYANARPQAVAEQGAAPDRPMNKKRQAKKRSRAAEEALE